MEQEFNTLDRLLLLQVLPAKTSFVKLKVADKLRKNIGFDEAEIKELELKTSEDGKVTWNNEKAKPKKIEIGDTGISLIKEGLDKLDKEEGLTSEFIPLCERFLEKE